MSQEIIMRKKLGKRREKSLKNLKKREKNLKN